MANPTIASFRGTVKHFVSAKEAYVWMLNRFFEAKPDVFADDSLDSLSMPTGSKRLYFERTPQALFAHNPRLAEDSNLYCCLVNGWYADVNLSNKQKLKNLVKFAKVANLERRRDWEWQVLP